MSKRLANTITVIRPPDSHCPLCQLTYKQRRANKTEEHIFPLWLQKHHNLLTQKLTHPNGVRRKYKSLKIDSCSKCNNKRFGDLEDYLAPHFKSDNPFDALRDMDDSLLAIWLAKIVWLMGIKSGHTPDPKTRLDPVPDTIVPQKQLPYIGFLGAIVRAYALNKQIDARLRDEPLYPPMFRPPYSFYRFKLDYQDQPLHRFNFHDGFGLLSAAMISDNIGMVCLFDMGLHRHWLWREYHEYFNRILHPIQFQELAARMVWDQSSLQHEAYHFRADWLSSENRLLMTNGSSCRDMPYKDENIDLEELDRYFDLYTDGKVRGQIVDGSFQFNTMLKHQNGNHWDCVNMRTWDDPPIWYVDHPYENRSKT